MGGLCIVSNPGITICSQICLYLLEISLSYTSFINLIKIHKDFILLKFYMHL